MNCGAEALVIGDRAHGHITFKWLVRELAERQRSRQIHRGPLWTGNFHFCALHHSPRNAGGAVLCQFHVQLRISKPRSIGCASRTTDGDCDRYWRPGALRGQHGTDSVRRSSPAIFVANARVDCRSYRYSGRRSWCPSSLGLSPARRHYMPVSRAAQRHRLFSPIRPGRRCDATAHTIAFCRADRSGDY